MAWNSLSSSIVPAPLVLQHDAHVEPLRAEPLLAGVRPRYATWQGDPSQLRHSPGARAVGATESSSVREQSLANGLLVAAALTAWQGSRWGTRRRRPPVQLKAQTGTTIELAEELRIAQEQVTQSLDTATPVPESFEQAVSFAAVAGITAMEAGQYRQSMYYDTGEVEENLGGNLGKTLPFVESLAKTLAGTDALEGGLVTCLFPDFGAVAMAENRWKPLPPRLFLDHLPTALPGAIIGNAEKNRMEQLLESKVILSICPQQTELPAITQLLQLMRMTGTDVPIIFINAEFIQNLDAAQGNLMKSAVKLANSIVRSFHLQQYDPPDDGEEFGNSAVVSRVWPRPFSLWEDDPEDPDAVDGFFLLDMDTEAPFRTEYIVEQLEVSRRVRKRMIERKGLIGGGFR